MDLDQLDLNPRIIAAVKKAKLKSVKEILHFSGPDLQRLTRLPSLDVQHLLRTASSHLQGSRVCTALHLHQQKQRFPAQHQRLSLGCPVLDGLLRGGLPLDGLTELAGPSSAGKTQLALQLCLSVQFPQRHGGLEAGAVYICTEEVFPSPRLRQLTAQQRRLRTDVPGDVVDGIKFGNQIFVEHVADVDTLLECVTKKVPALLSRGMARLVVIDSVAAPFRCEFDGAASVPRAQRLQALGAALRRLSCTFQSPVLCINQVTEATEEQGTAPGPQGQITLTVRKLQSKTECTRGRRAAPGGCTPVLGPLPTRPRGTPLQQGGLPVTQTAQTPGPCTSPSVPCTPQCCQAGRTDRGSPRPEGSPQDDGDKCGTVRVFRPAPVTRRMPMHPDGTPSADGNLTLGRCFTTLEVSEV